jgi:hypothetical protein
MDSDSKADSISRAAASSAPAEKSVNLGIWYIRLILKAGAKHFFKNLIVIDEALARVAPQLQRQKSVEEMSAGAGDASNGRGVLRLRSALPHCAQDDSLAIICAGLHLPSTQSIKLTAKS